MMAIRDGRPLKRIVAGLNTSGAISTPAGARPTPAIDKNPVAFAPVDDLVSPVTISTPTLRPPCASRRRSAQHFHQQTFFKDETALSKAAWPGMARSFTVPYTQLANVAAGKKQRADDERVGGEGQPHAV